MTKPEIKRYLEQIYGVQGITDVKTRIRRGGKIRDPKNPKKRVKKPDEKVATIVLKDDFVLALPDEVKQEIYIHFNKKAGKMLLEEQQKATERQRWETIRNQMQQKQEQETPLLLEAGTSAAEPAASAPETTATETPTAEAQEAPAEEQQQPTDKESTQEQTKNPNKPRRDNRQYSYAIPRKYRKKV